MTERAEGFIYYNNVFVPAPEVTWTIRAAKEIAEHLRIHKDNIDVIAAIIVANIPPRH